MWDKNIGKFREVFMEDDTFELWLENSIDIYQAVNQTRDQWWGGVGSGQD